MRWRVREFLLQEGLSAYTLERAVGRKLSARRVYALARNEPIQVRLETLEILLSTLRELTGKAVELTDLLEPEAHRRARR
jgi:hypothetical protein